MQLGVHEHVAVCCIALQDKNSRLPCTILSFEPNVQTVKTATRAEVAHVNPELSCNNVPAGDKGIHHNSTNISPRYVTAQSFANAQSEKPSRSNPATLATFNVERHRQ